MPVFFLRLFLLTFIAAAPGVVPAQGLPATAGVAGKPRKLQLLSIERISTLEQDSQTQWRAYLKKSEESFDREQTVMSEECRQAGLSAPQPAPNTSAQFAVDSKKQDAWYASDEAIKLAETVISFQTPSGGWSKSVNYIAGPRTPGTHWTSQQGNIWHYCGTLDNRSTTEQVRFLAKYHSITQSAAAKDSALRGLEWILEAQYPNGVRDDLELHPDRRPAVFERLKEVGKMASVVIGVETALDARGEVQLLEEIGSPAIWSYFNFASALQKGRDLIEQLTTLGKERICQIHCTDEDGNWLEHNQRLDLQAVKRTLDQMGWSGWLVMERSRDAKNPRDVRGNFGANAKYLKKIFS